MPFEITAAYARSVMPTGGLNIDKAMDEVTKGILYQAEQDKDTVFLGHLTKFSVAHKKAIDLYIEHMTKTHGRPDLKIRAIELVNLMLKRLVESGFEVISKPHRYNQIGGFHSNSHPDDDPVWVDTWSIEIKW